MRTVELNKMAASIASQRVRLSERLSELQAREKKICEREQQINSIEGQIDNYIKQQVEKSVKLELDKITNENKVKKLSIDNNSNNNNMTEFEEIPNKNDNLKMWVLPF